MHVNSFEANVAHDVLDYDARGLNEEVLARGVGPRFSGGRLCATTYMRRVAYQCHEMKRRPFSL